MLYYNALILTPQGYVRGGFRTENGRFVEILPECLSGEGINLFGLKVIPGLVDIHTHGCAGEDFSDGNGRGLTRMAEHHAQKGVTTFVPTSMSLPYEALERAFKTAEEGMKNLPQGCARIGGIHMEGPFFSEKRKGAQSSSYLKEPDVQAFSELYRCAGRKIRIVDVAPELPGAIPFIETISRDCIVSIAHTDAGYEQAAAAFLAGASHLTHLFNAMPPLLHRAPGVIGAAAERENVTAELICDGMHVHPSAVRLAFKLFPNRICLISDSVRCCGMEDGSYELGGQRIQKKDGVAKLDDGTLAGAAADLYDDLKNAVRFGIPEEDAVKAATIVPAGVIGLKNEIGSIEPGKNADFIVCDEQLALRDVYIGSLRV